MENQQRANPFLERPSELPETTEPYRLGEQRAARGLQAERGYEFCPEYKMGYESGRLALRLGIVKAMD